MVIKIKELTSIQIKKITRTRLQDNKITSRESYDEIINRILNKLFKNKGV